MFFIKYWTNQWAVFQFFSHDYTKCYLILFTLISFSIFAREAICQESEYQILAPPLIEEAIDSLEQKAKHLKSEIHLVLSNYYTAIADQDTISIESTLETAKELSQALYEFDKEPLEIDTKNLYNAIIDLYSKYYGLPLPNTEEEYGEIYSAHQEVLKNLDDINLTEIEGGVKEHLLVRPESNIPLKRNRLVNQSIDYLLKSPDKHLNLWRSRSYTYFPIIEPILFKEGIPDEMKYLAMIESGLVPTAKSRAGAAGMWQFMPATGKAYGLSIDFWVDERQDPIKATKAAAQHLNDLYEMFGEDWLLAMAGYNCSPAKVKSAIRKARRRGTKNPTFWDIYKDLPRETRSYVPMFIATTLILQNESDFDLHTVSPSKFRFEYDEVTIKGTHDLSVLSRLANTSLQELKTLNPELTQWASPPVSSYSLRIPTSTKNRFISGYKELPTDSKSTIVKHYVRKGDTLMRISKRYNISLSDLKTANRISGSRIYIGQHLLIPVTGSSQRSLRYTSSGNSANSVTHYRVKKGDVLSKIGEKYGVSTSNLMQWNGLKNNRIYPGQLLKIPHNNSGGRSRQSYSTYRVKRGDTLGKIAYRYGTTIANLKRINNLRSSRIIAGKTLKVPRNPSSKKWIAHNVQRGDTLSEIADTYKVKVSDIRKWNSLPSTRINRGQRLAIYTSL